MGGTPRSVFSAGYPCPQSEGLRAQEGGADEAANPVVGQVAGELHVLHALDEPTRGLGGEAALGASGRKRRRGVSRGKRAGGGQGHGVNLQVALAVPATGQVCNERRREVRAEELGQVCLQPLRVLVRAEHARHERGLVQD